MRVLRGLSECLRRLLKIMNLFVTRFANSLEVLLSAVAARVSRNPDEVCVPAWNPFTRHKIFACASARRGLHTIDNADDLWQIEAIDRPSEALRTHKEGSGGRMDRLKRVGVLNLGNYYFPHMFHPSRVRFISSGTPAGRSCPLHSAWLEAPDATRAFTIRVGRR